MMVLNHKKIDQPLMKNRLRIKHNLKFIFPFFGVSLLAIVFIGIGFRKAIVIDAYALLDLNHASALRYNGHDVKGQPFQIQSKRGTEISKKEVVFDTLHMAIDLKKGETLNVDAKQGIFDKNSKMMELSGDVQLTHANGLTLRTTQATINIDNGSAKNDAPIEGSNKQAHIKAHGFRTEGDNQLVFLGNPELIIRTH